MERGERCGRMADKAAKPAQRAGNAELSRSYRQAIRSAVGRGARTTMMKSVRQSAALLPLMVETAQRIHKTPEEVRTAVLLAWTGLAGVAGWTPEMVRRVEALTR